MTKIHEASYWGHKEVVASLLEKGANVNAQDYDGNTPLYWAVLGGNKEIVEVLVKVGADINIKNSKHGDTPLHWAVFRRDTRRLWTYL